MTNQITTRLNTMRFFMGALKMWFLRLLPTLSKNYPKWLLKSAQTLLLKHLESFREEFENGDLSKAKLPLSCQLVKTLYF